MVKSNSENDQLRGVICLGEIGRITDFSSVNGIIEIVSALFQMKNEDCRTAASFCLGNISIGNPQFFLPKVFALVDKS